MDGSTIHLGGAGAIVLIVVENFFRYPAVSMRIFGPNKVFVVQSIVGLCVLNHGCPRMILSCPRFATKKPSLLAFSPCRIHRLQYCVMVPA